VRWFGPRVSRLRAAICVVAALINSHIPFFQDFTTIRSPDDFLGRVVAYVFFYVLFLGVLSVATIHVAAHLLAQLVKESVTPNPNWSGAEWQIRQEIVEDRFINWTLVLTELLLLYGYHIGLVWPRPVRLL
jgi:hypothetical protein